MTDLTMEQLDALRAELPEDYDWLECKLKEAKDDPNNKYKHDFTIAGDILMEYKRKRELALVNFALHKYGNHV